MGYEPLNRDLAFGNVELGDQGPTNMGTGVNRTHTGPMTFEEALDAFLRALEGKNRTAATRRAYETDLRHFIAWLVDNIFEPVPETVQRADITEYLAFLAREGLLGL